MRAYLAVFLSVLLAELGDKTQLTALLFAASPGVTRTGVFLAAAGALVLSTAVAVAVGAHFQQWVRPEHLKIAAAVGFIAIGVWMALSR
jgi:putative Ca2+/H+ antiporter (TMEM165/GDT1 family)